MAGIVQISQAAGNGIEGFIESELADGSMTVNGIRVQINDPVVQLQAIFSTKADIVLDNRRTFVLQWTRTTAVSPLPHGSPCGNWGAIGRKKVEESMKEVSGQFHAEFDPQYFGSAAGSSRPRFRRPLAVAPH
jgi:hypothetical protein